MTVYLGADHAGTLLKEQIKRALSEDGHAVEDVSPSAPEDGDDYPDYAFAVAQKVAGNEDARGILICDTGIGMAVAANKVQGITAALVTDMFGARRAREHNDANVLVFGSELIKPAAAAEAARVFLETPFSGAERHRRRLGKIAYYAAHGIPPSPAER
jgi:ribose 5-phosphate isomerase B